MLSLLMLSLLMLSLAQPCHAVLATCLPADRLIQTIWPGQSVQCKARLPGN